MKNLLKNFELSVKILSAIWLRKPILFYSRNSDVFNIFFQEIIHFIPDYRQIIIYGKVPNSFIYNKFSSKILTIEDCSLLEQSLYQCFEEETINTPPLQIIYFHIDEWILTNLLINFKKGWIAFTNCGEKENIQFAESNDIIFINVETMKATFPKSYSTNIDLEYYILMKSHYYSPDTTRFLLQKKFNEIRLAEKIIVNEIEAGNKVSQVEIEEYLEIDSLSFLKALELLEAECSINIKSYIKFRPKKIDTILNKIKRLNGINTVTCFQDGRLIGLIKETNFISCSKQLFYPFITLSKYLYSLFGWGADQRLIIETKIGKKILIFPKDELCELKNLMFALVIEEHVNAILILKEIQTIFKEI